MYDIQTFTGRIIELRRFMNRRPRITEHDPSRERWEVWLAAPDGSEHKFIVGSRSMPARVGHSLHLLHVDGTPVGLYNLETGKRENFTRADPALLFRDIDGFVWPAGCFLAAVFAMAGMPLGTMAVVALLILYYPLMVSARLASRRSLQAQVDAELDQIQADHVIRPFRRQH
jgi:hypothetical protein